MEKNMIKNSEPDGQFVDKLGWQLSSEFRRLERMRTSGKVTVPRRLVATSLMAGVLLTGVAAIKAADYFKDSWRKKIELARVTTDIELKKARLASFREQAARIEDLFSRGLIEEERRVEMTFVAESAQRDLDRALLNLEEVESSGRPPRDELYAPLVGGRDFVTERLRNEIGSAEAYLEMVAKRWKRLDELVAAGLVHQAERGAIQAEIDSRKAAIEGILERIELRKRFVAGEITAREVEVRERKSVAEKNLVEARAKVGHMKKEMERLQGLEARGLVSPIETSQLRYALEAAEAESKLAALEVEVLEKVLSRKDP
jgi:multidrug resistance efflux pump